MRVSHSFPIKISVFQRLRESTFKMNICAYILIGFISASVVDSQVCSPPGQLCTRTTDCCKGCCEAHTCVERSFSCSTDLIQQPGYSSCVSYFCPVGNICYLREVCPPENPCPRQPACRRVDMTNNYSEWQYRNSFHRPTANPALFSFSILAIGLMSYWLI